MKRAGAACPNCGSTKTPDKEKIMGQDIQYLICVDCDYIAWWSDFYTKTESKES